VGEFFSTHKPERRPERMTAPVRRASTENYLGDHQRRIEVLEASPVAAPALASVPTGYPVVHSVQGWELQTYTADPNNDGFGALVKDTAAPFGGYISSVGAANGKGIYLGLGPLGPGTGWWVDLWLRQGNDSGNVLVEYGTTPADEYNNSSTYNVGTLNSAADPSLDPNFSGWFSPQAGADTIQLYAAGGTAWDVYVKQASFYVSGADGAMLTANGDTTAANPPAIPEFFAGQYGMNGGGDASVYWWIKIRSSGKNASSSGYGFRFAGYRLYRMNGDGMGVS